MNLKIYDGSQFRNIGKVNEDNLGLLLRSGGIMTGQILGDDLSLKGSPAYSFDQDTDTGMFRSGPNKIGFSTEGNERAIIDNFGLNIENQGQIVFREQSSNGSNGVVLKAKASLSNDVSLTLPDAITNGGFLQTDGSGQLSFQIVNGVPTGAIFALPDTQATGTGYQSNGIPTGYLECNGASLVRSTYAALFAVIGTRYGVGSSSNNTTFNLPDLRGEFIRGWDDGKGVDANRSFKSTQSDQWKNHQHVFGGDDMIANSSIGNFQSIGSSGNFAYDATSTASGNGRSMYTKDSPIDSGGTETRPRNVALLACIKY